jgi:peptide deformylase
MTVRAILKMGDPRLLRVAQPVPLADGKPPPAFLAALLRDLRDTMRAAHGAGLAAPQIGEDWQVVVFGSGQPNPRYPEAPVVPPTVLVNPTIEPLGPDTEVDWEGCLSVPGLRGRVPRHRRIRYSGWGEHGERIERVVDGFHARVVQHECDHLIGRLYPTRMTDLTQLGYTEVLFPGLDPGHGDD